MSEKKNAKDNKLSIEHERNLVNVAYTYYNIPWMTIKGLALSFKVSENTITDWLCEAIEKRYVESAMMCSRIKDKHISEYETKHGIHNSELRDKYNDVMLKRKFTTTPKFVQSGCIVTV